MSLSEVPHSTSQDRDSHFVCLSLFEVIVVAVLLGVGVPISVLHEAMFGDSSAPRLFSILIDAVQGGLFFGILFIGVHRLARAGVTRLKRRSS